jgi:hypothetical protein
MCDRSLRLLAYYAGSLQQVIKMNEKRRVVCWQGWKLEIPRRWDPVKLEGDHAEGYALFADTLRPRLGLRWQTPKKSEKAGKKGSEAFFAAVNRAMQAEVGSLAAKEAKAFLPADEAWQSPLLYIEPQPPGRDVYSVYSQTSGRLLQVAYHAHRRENILASSLLPILGDLPLDRAAPWSIFDLNCVVPAGMKLKSHRLTAGDLGLTFADRFNEVTIRQIAVAQLALQRQSLDSWIIDQQKTGRRYHQSSGVFADTSVLVNQRELSGRMSRMTRRPRYMLLWNLPRMYFTIALHDADRDRLILLHGTDESLLRAIAGTVASM